eukprot:TRINITY_DN23161_c0_g1_i1.p1 TRINITY_DN23161_c0_g1~~TRINITY_DN23161_c0_g1_i1.p1  ORF type:complete len:132 (-),score=16.51 TRINITY_DN23161_c0_g1_i1:305-700(-)
MAARAATALKSVCRARASSGHILTPQVRHLIHNSSGRSGAVGAAATRSMYDTMSGSAVGARQASMGSMMASSMSSAWDSLDSFDFDDEYVPITQAGRLRIATVEDPVLDKQYPRRSYSAARSDDDDFEIRI